ncbi:MAG: hypothetical protein KGL35_29005, partial [Bradyrhizobium sp.]|nr:hypothetical protein [Bradyrhizobium sp.]
LRTDWLLSQPRQRLNSVLHYHVIRRGWTFCRKSLGWTRVEERFPDRPQRFCAYALPAKIWKDHGLLVQGIWDELVVSRFESNDLEVHERWFEVPKQLQPRCKSFLASDSFEASQ